MKISGYVKKTLFRSNNGYTVGLFKVKECPSEIIDYKNKTITFVCTMSEINDEIYYSLEGNFVRHERFGLQFNATKYEVSSPSEKNGIIAYLSSGIFKGIGEKLATNIVDMYGEDSIKVIKNNPEDLLLVRGITKKKINELHQKLVNLDYNEKTIILLTDMGFSVSEAILLIENYKSNLLKIMKNNFYTLKEFIPFLKLDNIYLKENKEDNEIRIKALIPYVINNICFKTGDTYIRIDNLYLEFLKYFKKRINIETFNYYLNLLNKERILLIFNEFVMLKDYKDAEMNISNFVKSKTKIKNYIKDKELDEYFNMYEKSNNIVFNEEQKLAIKGSLKNDLFCITGGPGTGKTTIVKAIVDIYKLINYKPTEYGLNESYSEDIILLAPTGRSAKKLGESVITSASTIHKFLKWNKETKEFGVNEHNKSKAKLVIVDEVSMIDIFLFDSLIKGLKNNVKIVLVGDEFQLPSISPGNVLKDILNYKNINKITLKKIYRAKEDSFIIEFANIIKNKEELKKLNNHSDFTFINSEDINVKKYLKQICNKYKKSLDDLEVLVPMYKGENGIDNLNIIMQSIFNKKDSKSITINNKEYKVHDKVIQLVNDVDNNVFNGDIGYILDIDQYNKEIQVDFMGNIVTYKKEKFDNFTLAYAISIHKSQGSEYDNVVIVLSKGFKRMLYNKLIYTAVTRAKKGLVIIGKLDYINEAINNDYSENRNSKLNEYLNE